MAQELHTAKDFLTEMTKDHFVERKKKKTQRLIEKWEPTRFLNGIPNKKKGLIAQLLENQAIHLAGLMQETSSFQVGDVGGWVKVTFPIVRRVFAKLLANEIVSVQPIDAPAQAIFYYDYIFEKGRPGFNANQSLFGQRSPGPGDANYNRYLHAQGPITGEGAPYELVTGYSRRIFSVPLTSITYSGSTGTSLAGVVTGTLSAFSFKLAANAATAALDFHGSSLALFRPELTANINLQDSGKFTFRSLTAIDYLTSDSTIWGHYDHLMTSYAGDTVTIWSNYDMALTSSPVTLTGPAMTDLQINSQFGDGWTYLGDFENDENIPEISIKIDSQVITAVTRKLKASWTQESAQDMEAMHNIDAEKELTTTISEYIGRDIDREILIDLIRAAATKSAWSRMINKQVYYDENTNTIQPYRAYGAGYPGQTYATQQEWYQTLVEVMNGVSAQIYKKSLISAATWAVTSPDVGVIFESMLTFKPSSGIDPTVNKFSMGIEKVGTAAGKYDVFKDPYFPSQLMLLGFKGTSVLDSGYVYAPYVPLVVTPVIFNPTDLTPVKGVMTRYAKAIIRAEMYGLVYITDLQMYGY